MQTANRNGSPSLTDELTCPSQLHARDQLRHIGHDSSGGRSALLVPAEGSMESSGIDT
jgi:hypothetical protein